MRNRAIAAFTVIALLGAGVAPCAGWQSTAQARKDCCVEGQCPEELTSVAGHQGGHSSKPSQAEADQCCAASEQKHQQESAQFVDAAFVLVQPVDRLAMLAIDVPALGRALPHADPIHPPPTSLHVLFSVFLV